MSDRTERRMARLPRRLAVVASANSGKTYCTNPAHGYGEHDASCLPPADPADRELRLLRAIFGLCSLCDVAEPHSHVPEDRP